MSDSSGKRTINGFKTWSKETGKNILKGGVKVAELAGRGGTRILGALLKSDSFKTILTTVGMIGASIVCPTIGLGLLAVVGAKWIANKIMGKDKDEYGQTKLGIVDALKETIMGTKKITDIVCSKTSPYIDKAHDFIQEKGTGIRDKIDNKGDKGDR